MTSLRGRISLLFAAFFLLVVVSAGLTSWGLQVQSDDALTINLAGRQRMLVELMTRLALERWEGEPVELELRTAMDAFESNLRVFQSGGLASYLPGEAVQVEPARDREIQRQLDQVSALWIPYRQDLETLISQPVGSTGGDAARRRVDQGSAELVAAADRVVRLYQEQSNRWVVRLRWIQAGFFLGALALLGLGTRMVRASILAPLQKLAASAVRIGKGDLATAASVSGPQELQVLGEAFEHMRLDLEASQKELLAWTGTLEARVQQRTQALDALHAVSQDISSRLHLDPVLRSVTEKARHLLNADAALLCLLDSTYQELRLQAFSGPHGIIQKTYTSPENLYVQEILSASCALPDHLCSGTCGILDSGYRASHLAAPLMAGGRVIGALCVGSQQPERFYDEEAALLTKLAGAAAIAIENARLYGQVERLATLEERQRIAAEMHDGLAQVVDYLGLMVDQAEERLLQGQVKQAGEALGRLRYEVDQASGEVRRSIARLQDDLPRSLSLQAQLESLVADRSARSSEPVEWLCEFHPNPLHLPTETVSLVLGVAQEALTNALRHASASRIQVQLAITGDRCRLVVEDNGRGYTPEALPQDGRRHFGVRIMHARAAHLKGELKVRSQPGAGTCVELTWALQERQDMQIKGINAQKE